MLFLIFGKPLSALRIRGNKEKPEANLNRKVQEEAGEFTWIVAIASLLESLEGKNRRKSPWDTAKAKTHLVQICCEVMCVFKEM